MKIWYGQWCIPTCHEPNAIGMSSMAVTLSELNVELYSILEIESISQPRRRRRTGAKGNDVSLHVLQNLARSVYQEQMEHRLSITTTL